MAEIERDSTRLWQRAARIFDSCLELPAERQAKFLQESCGADSELVAAVTRLLERDETRDDLLERGPDTALADAVTQRLTDHWIGRELGSYRLIEHLGQGGMGQVFLAERADQAFSKRVAVKIFAAGMASQESLERFRRERQILASLEHPNIARLLDGGGTEEGLPYLVMEHVGGESIVGFCDRRKLGVKRRIELFREVCKAVDYAHRSLVVHRDLKPSNILVTELFEPKLLDFGIAKLLDDSVLDEPELDGAVKANRRTTVLQALTPAYASPEQILGKSISTASDVYSLGVLLFEILTGRLPFASHESWAQEVLARVAERRPSLPSSLFRGGRVGGGPVLGGPDRLELARLRGSRPAILARQLAGDLDTIVIRAMDPRVERRYASVMALSEDLDNYLEGRPVRARRDSFPYRAGKFVRRNRVAVAVSGLLALLALGAVMRVVQEREIARSEQRKAERVVDLLIGSFKLADPQWSNGETVTAREVLDAAAVRLESDLVAEPMLRADMMHTIGTVYANLDLYEKAEPHLARSLQLRRLALAADHPAVIESLEVFAKMKLGQGQLDQASEAATLASELRQRRGEGGLAASLRLLAEVEIEQGMREAALERLESALQLQREETGEQTPEFIAALMSYGQSIQLLRADYAGAEDFYRRALELQRDLQPRDEPRTAEILGQLARVVQLQDRLPEAARLGHEALAMSRRLHGEEHQSVAQSLNALANIERLSGHVERAEELYRESLAIRRDLVGDNHPKLASAMYNLATLLHRDLGRLESAEELYRQAVELFGRTASHKHPNMGFYKMGLGRILTDLDRPEEAEKILLEALGLFNELGPKGRGAASAKSALAGALLRLDRHQEAEELLLEGLPVLRAALGDDHRITKRALRRLVIVYELTGRSQQATETRIALEDPAT